MKKKKKKKQEKREEGIKGLTVRENKIIICKITVTVHICTVIVARLDICKGMKALMRVYFMLYCENFCTFCILDPLMQLLLTTHSLHFDTNLSNNKLDDKKFIIVSDQLFFFFLLFIYFFENQVINSIKFPFVSDLIFEF